MKKMINGLVMTPAERTAGRYMRAPDHSGADSGAGGNNLGGASAGNSGQFGTESADGNNTGQTFDPAVFWNNPDDQGGGSPDSGSAGPTPNQDGSQGQGGFDAAAFAQSVSNTTFDPVFDDSVVQQLAQGDLAGVNQKFNAVVKQVLEASVRHSATLMQALGDQILQRSEHTIEERLNGTLSAQDTDSFLNKTFPASYSNPAVQPVLREIYQQSLKNTKGNKSEAIAMTKTMLSLLPGAGQVDSTGQGTPTGQHNGTASLLADLLGK